MNKVIHPRTAYGILLLLFIVLGWLFYTLGTEYPLPGKAQATVPEKKDKLMPSGNDDQVILSRKRQAIEDQYPQYKGFEQQESFAGTSVVSKRAGDGSYYFAYITHGSGLPIAQATCFRVDKMNRVYKVGEFPDLTDSYAGYGKIDPVTCAGVKGK